MWSVLFVSSLLAFTVSTLCGGGAGLMLIPLLGLVVPTAQVPVALSVGTATSSLSRLCLFRRSIRWSVVVWFVPAALPFAALGAWSLTLIQPAYLELGLGLFLFGNIFSLLREPEPVRGVKRNPLAWLAIGAAGGFLSGFTGAIGLAFNRFFFRSGLAPEEIVATRAANELLLHLVKLSLYAIFGLMARDALVAGSVVACAAAFASLFAKRALVWLEGKTFTRIGYAATCLAGVAMLASASSSLAEHHGVDLGGSVGAAGLQAKLSWRDGAASLNWLRGRQLEIECTTDLASLPAEARELVTRLGIGAESIIYERVLHFGGASGYAITIVRNGQRTKVRV